MREALGLRFGYSKKNKQQDYFKRGKVKYLIFFLVFSASCRSQSIEDEIVLVGVDSLSRGEIGELILNINRLNPSVVSVDITFANYSNYEDDLKLLKATNECKALVMATAIRDFKESDLDYNFEGFIFQTEPHFLLNAKTGFTNVIIDTSNTLIKFSGFEKVVGELEYHFSVRTAMSFDSIKTMSFVRRNPKVIKIDYKEGKRKFRTFSASDVLSYKLKERDIEEKIVMIGFLGPGNEDRFFSPFSKTPNEPDIYGVEYLANIVAQVLE